jgi:hypothetical protein
VAGRVVLAVFVFLADSDTAAGHVCFNTEAGDIDVFNLGTFPSNIL